ncbi:barstar family protein [Kribbella sp. NPDC051137]|uniref:barstar family protein n=1 Tax=Kribbella sp. NPDC051137 TaxID=3155045 RepID=UPI00343A5765
MGTVLIDGRDVFSERDLHRILERQLEFGDYYGRNLAALRDRLLADVPRPVRLVWTNSAVSRSRLGEELFARIKAVLEEVVQQDIDLGWEDRFEFLLE